MTATRDELKSGEGTGRSMTDLTTYRTMVENVRDRPFDNPTLARFGLDAFLS